jgi:hypothetical protein
VWNDKQDYKSQVYPPSETNSSVNQKIKSAINADWQNHKSGKQCNSWNRNQIVPLNYQADAK